MADRDLTPEEARAEVEAFMGEGWDVTAFQAEENAGAVYVTADKGSVSVDGVEHTYRAAVDSLKAAWRDAVRPWVDEAMDAGALLDRDEANHKSSIERRDAAYAEELARLLKEDSK